MFVQSFHSMLMIIITLGLFLAYFMKNREQKFGKVRLIVLASITATTGLLLAYFKPFGFIIDYMAICLPLTCLMVVIAIWKYDFMAAKALARSKAFESNRDAILLVSQQNKIIDYNKMASQLLGELGITLAEGDLDTVFESAPAFVESLKNGTDFTLKWGVEPTERIFEISTRSIDSNHLSQGWIKTIGDVTEVYEWNKRLKRLAMMDELSGLNNRRAFMQKGESIIQEATQKKDSLHLLMMDLDHFKNINDQFGHLNGDRVINHMGTALKTSYNVNSLIARLGGEEFAVLLTGFGDAEIKEKTTRFLADFSEHTYYDQDKTFHVTVSIGIAKRKESGQTLNELIHMADKALYRAKDNGRNRVVEFAGETPMIKVDDTNFETAPRHEEQVQRADNSYRVAEQKARDYFEVLDAQVTQKSYGPMLTNDFQQWQKRHCPSKRISLFSGKRKLQPDPENPQVYLNWLNRSGKLQAYLERSVAYIYMRDLGKALDSPAEQERIQRAGDSNQKSLDKTGKRCC